MIISCDIKDGNENLAERSTLALNNDIIKKQFEGIIAKFDNSSCLSGSIGEDPRSGVSIRIRQVWFHGPLSFESFLYYIDSAVSSPSDRSKRFTLWQPCSFQHQLDFSGKLCGNYVRRLFTHISTTVYSQIGTYSFIMIYNAAEWTGASWQTPKW